MGEHDVDPAGVDSMRAFGSALARLKQRSGRSLSQLAGATVGAEGGQGLSRSTLNGYFKGRHLPQQGVGREFRLLLGELGVCDDVELDEWWAAVDRLRRCARSDGPAVSNPYPGLRPFAAADAQRFFGRAALTERLVDEVTTRAASGEPIVVVGPSGAGKSSLLCAGLLPRLTDAGRLPILVVPGRKPLEALPARPEHPEAGRQPVLVLDQLEEIFAAEVTDADRRAFIASVWSAARQGPVVLGLRADFYGHALRHPELASALQNAQVVVGPLADPELRAAVTEPARTVGVEVDSGLVELLVREVSPSVEADQDAAHEQGALPLLAHTLRAAFDAAVRRGEKVVGVADYRSVGGLRLAVAETAEAAYASLAPSSRLGARRVFLRLVDTGDNAVDTRRRTSRDELLDGRPDAEAEEVDDILDTFVAHRLLTTDDTTVQISHEALLHAWPRLREWLDDDRAGRRVHRRLTLAARTWRDNGRTEDDLYQGGALDNARTWADGHPDDLNPLEHEFLDAAAAGRAATEAADRRRVRRRYQLITAAVVLVVVAVSALIDARNTQIAADHDRELALSRDIAIKAERLRDSDPSLAAQLAAIAYRSAPTVEARSALLDSTARPVAARHLGDDGPAHLVAAAAGLLAISADDDGAVTLSRTGQDGPIGPPLRVGSRAAAMTISTDGALLAVLGENGTLRLWSIRDPAAPVELATLAGPSGSVASVAISPDGRTVAAGGTDAKIRIWNIADPTKTTELSGPRDAVTSVAFAPDGRTLAAGSRDRGVHRFTLTDPAGPRPLPVLTGFTGQVFSVAISPDSRVLAAGTSTDRAVYLWDVSDPANPRSLGALTGPASWVTYIDFSPAGDRIIGGSSDRKLWEWDVASHTTLRTLPHPGVLTTAIYVDEHTVVTLAEDGVTRTWTVPGPVIDHFGDTVFSVDFTNTRPMLAVGPGVRDNRIHLIDVTVPDKPVRTAALVPADGSTLSGPAAVRDDGRLLAAGSSDGRLLLWDIADSAAPRQLAEIGAGESTVAWLEFQPNGTLLAVALKDGTVTLLDVADPGRPASLASWTESDSALNDIRFSPDGKRLVTGSDDGNAYLYEIADLADPRLVATLAVGDAATSAAFSANGAILAVGAAADDNVHLWSLRTADEPESLGGSLDGPVADLHQLTFHPRRDELAGASVDGTIWLWDLTDPRQPEPAATVTASADAAMSLAYSQDGALLAGGTRDGVVRIWRTDPEAALRWLCDATGEPITPVEWDQFIPNTPYSPPCS